MLRSFLSNDNERKRKKIRKLSHRTKVSNHGADYITKEARLLTQQNFVIYSKLDELMERKKIKSYSELGRKLGIGFDVIGRYGKMKKFRDVKLKQLDIQILYSICMFFGCDIGDLLSFNGNDGKESEYKKGFEAGIRHNKTITEQAVYEIKELLK